MNSVLRLMRLCQLNIGRPDRRGLCCWRIDDYWPLGRAERSRGHHLGSPAAWKRPFYIQNLFIGDFQYNKYILLHSVAGNFYFLSKSVGPKHRLLLLLRQDCGPLWNMEYLLQFHMFEPPLVALPDRPLSPRGPSWAFILLAVCFWHGHPVLVSNAASSLILFFPMHTERLSDGQPISESSDTYADLWGYGFKIIVRPAPQHNACQTQTHWNEFWAD